MGRQTVEGPDVIDTEFIGIPYRAGTTADLKAGYLAPLAELNPDVVVVVTERELAPMVRPLVEASVSVAPTIEVLIPGGDKNKNLEALETAAVEAIRGGATRSSVVVAAGGGFVGNLAGLMANLLYRGIRLVHVPTTLLHMSDGVLSVKQAVNTPIGKNQLGTYYRPEMVWANVDYLATLPPEEIVSSLCESTKNGLAIMPDQLERTFEIVKKFVSAAPPMKGEGPESGLTHGDALAIIEDSILAKDRVMTDDHRERHRGLICEYGHTVGHALELARKGYITHGSAVAFGMLVAADVAVRQGVADQSVLDAHERVLAPLQPDLGTVTAGELLDIIRYDNKRGYTGAQSSDSVDMILLEGLGQPHGNLDRPLVPVSRQLLSNVLAERLSR